MEKPLGILGGMGPLATVDFFKKVVLLTDAKCDQEHIHIVVDSNPEIPDRSSYIAGELDQSPLAHLIASARRLEDMGVNCIVMPCNTAHYFYDDIRKKINTPFLNMIEETAKNIKSTYLNTKKVAVLATAGTRNSGIYEKFLERHGLEVIYPDQEQQEFIMDLIYKVKNAHGNVDVSGLNQIVDCLCSEQNVDVIVLGCTELSVLFDKLITNKTIIDPAIVLAKAAILFFGKKCI